MSEERTQSQREAESKSKEPTAQPTAQSTQRTQSTNQTQGNEQAKEAREAKEEEDLTIEQQIQRRRERVNAWRMQRANAHDSNPDPQAQAQAQSQAQAQAQAQSQAQAQAQAQAQSQAQAQAQSQAQAQAQAQAEVEESEAEAHARVEAQARAEADARALAEADAHAEARRIDRRRRGLLEDEESDDDEPSRHPPAAAAAAAAEELDELDAYMAEIEKVAGAERSRLGSKVEEEERLVAVEAEPEEAPRVRGKVLPATNKQGVAFEKNLYVEVREIGKMSSEEVKAYRAELGGIGVKGKGCPRPIKAFTQCGLSEKILAVSKKLGYIKPTPIQAQAIPAIMSGRDVIGCAKTGSGKTLAFVLPLLRHVLDQPALHAGDGPIGLICAPTRELAAQIYAEVKKFVGAVGLRAVCINGGKSVSNQISSLKRGAEVVVCTPGRMIDMLTTNAGRVTNLARVSYVCLDEADRMFDMGFESQVMMMLEGVQPARQVVMFSATFPLSVEQAARRILKRPLVLSVGGRARVAETITQLVDVVAEDDKFKRLLGLLGHWHPRGLVLIFVDTQEACGRLQRQLMSAEYGSVVLHGGLDQIEREFTINDFTTKIQTVMIATSIAARGLDINDLVLVVNYTCPNHLEDYVHRVGRTGRMGHKGTACTFITPEEEAYSVFLIKLLRDSAVQVPEDLQRLYDRHDAKRKAGLASSLGTGYGGKGFHFDESEQQKLNDERRMARRAEGIESSSDDEFFDPDEGEAGAGAGAGAGQQTVLVDAGTGAGAVEVTFMTEDTSISTQASKQVLDQRSSRSSTVGEAVRKGEITKVVIGDEIHYEDEVYINDYPQHARWRVTNKDAMREVSELTGTALTTRGTFIAPGRSVAPGERKLFIFIEGTTELSVRRARQEIERGLAEAMAQGNPNARRFNFQ